MNYELAKELKEAGFPFTKVPYEVVYKIIDENAYQKLRFRNDGDHFGTYIEPNLSELIEACGDEFWALTQQGTNQWECNDAQGKILVKDKKPEEAVARLWLNLNENTT